MKPLNGKCAMTREERNARRRVGNLTPFAAELRRKTARKWRDKNAETIREKRRAKYAENPERHREVQRRYAEAHPEKRKASWQKWAAKNRDYLKARDKARSADKAKMAAQVARMKERRQTDPEYAARVREQKRAKYRRDKHTARGLRWRLKFIWIPRWEKVVEAGDEAIAKYLRRAGEETTRYFWLWHKRDPYGVIKKILEGG